MKTPGGTSAGHLPSCKYPTLILLRRTKYRGQILLKSSQDRGPVIVFRLAIDRESGEPRGARSAPCPAPFRGGTDQNAREFSGQAGTQVGVGVADANVVVDEREQGQRVGEIVVRGT